MFFTVTLDAQAGIVADAVDGAKHHIGPGQGAAQARPAVLDAAVMMMEFAVVGLHQFAQVRQYVGSAADVQDLLAIEIGDGRWFSVYRDQGNVTGGRHGIAGGWWLCRRVGVSVLRGVLSIELLLQVSDMLL